MNHYYFQSPIGTLKICEEDNCITQLSLEKEWSDTLIDHSPFTAHSDLLYEASHQLSEYFAGKRKTFDLPLCPKGTDFQKRVWKELTGIPYGETRCYQDIAVGIGNANAVRAVGQANNKNPIIIFIPCHRVIGKNGTLVGFGCGLDVKQKLLELEKTQPSIY